MIQLELDLSTELDRISRYQFNPKLSGIINPLRPNDHDDLMIGIFTSMIQIKRVIS